jgi:organic hydroperoxide reductase OsmC/OhrA
VKYRAIRPTASIRKKDEVHPYPHLYVASAVAGPSGPVAVPSPGLPEIATAPPPEFDGPGGVWSPEALLCAALADCFILTFRALARGAKFDWLGLDCRVDGVLEKAEGVTQFTRYTTYATLKVGPGSDVAKARTLLERAEHYCLVSNSVRGKRTLVAEVVHPA